MIAILKLMTLILGFKVDKSSSCPVPDFCAFIYIDIYSAFFEWEISKIGLSNLHIFSDRTFEP